MNANAQDTLPGTISSSLATTNPASAGSNFRSPVACLMIFCLHFFWCESEDIFRVLESYGMGGSVSDVDRYVQEEQFPRYDEMGPPPDGRRVYTRSTAITLTVDFAHGWPMQVEIGACWISALFPHTIVVVEADDRRIVTSVVDGHLRCCVWEEMDFWVLMG
ncbi:hypothetical protein MMC22_008937 [Lobaria immixta]|nr:hypothetical protein [Lobaria immixta]